MAKKKEELGARVGDEVQMALSRWKVIKITVGHNPKVVLGRGASWLPLTHAEFYSAFQPRKRRGKGVLWVPKPSAMSTGG